MLYRKYIKRFLDIICALGAIVFFSWLYIGLAIVVKVKLGSPIIFTQIRPGIIDKKTGKEKLFKLYKFRSMSNEKNSNGDLLPDEERLTTFGKWLRGSSLDELPEAFNILIGDMSIIGPRPQLIKDMVFMSKEERQRHLVRPGLSGLAQTKGRNALLWENKLATDIEYIKNVNFIRDLQIVIETFIQVFFRKSSSSNTSYIAEVEITDDYGDYLLKKNKISNKYYKQKMQEAEKILFEYRNKK